MAEIDKTPKQSSGELSSVTSEFTNILKAIYKGVLDGDELDLYAGMLKTRNSTKRFTEGETDVIINKTEQVNGYLQKIHQGMLSCFGIEIGENRINSFFERFDPRRVVVVRDDLYVNLRSDFSRFKFSTEEVIVDTKSAVERTIGVTDPITGMIFIRESEIDSPQVITEEIVHNFLFDRHNMSYGKLKANIKFIRFCLNAARRKYKDFRTNRKGGKISLTDEEIASDYFSDPNEQITKAMTRRICMNVFDDDFNGLTIYHDLAADKGDRLISELGWNKILMGNYRVKNPQDFRIECKASHLSEYLQEMRSSADNFFKIKDD